MAAKQSQSMQSIINDTFVRGSAERAAFTTLLAGPVNTNTQNAVASVLAKKKNWEALADTVREQWGRK